MNTPQEKLQAAMKYAMTNRPAVGGFPFLAECLRQAGVQFNHWVLPAAQSIYVMTEGVVVIPGNPLLTGMTTVPAFDEAALITALRTDQAGKSTFPEFLMAAWQAGVVRYTADFSKRTVTYYGAHDESYQELYPVVVVETISQL